MNSQKKWEKITDPLMLIPLPNSSIRSFIHLLARTSKAAEDQEILENSLPHGNYKSWENNVPY